jgi:hypothetical protein
MALVHVEQLSILRSVLPQSVVAGRRGQPEHPLGSRLAERAIFITSCMPLSRLERGRLTGNRRQILMRPETPDDIEASSSIILCG